MAPPGSAGSSWRLSAIRLPDLSPWLLACLLALSPSSLSLVSEIGRDGFCVFSAVEDEFAHSEPETGECVRRSVDRHKPSLRHGR